MSCSPYARFCPWLCNGFTGYHFLGWSWGVPSQNCGNQQNQVGHAGGTRSGGGDNELGDIGDGDDGGGDGGGDDGGGGGDGGNGS